MSSMVGERNPEKFASRNKFLIISLGAVTALASLGAGVAGGYGAAKIRVVKPDAVPNATAAITFRPGTNNLNAARALEQVVVSDGTPNLGSFLRVIEGVEVADHIPQPIGNTAIGDTLSINVTTNRPNGSFIVAGVGVAIEHYVENVAA